MARRDSEVDVFDLKSLEGVGRATEEKLLAAGVSSILDLAVATPRDLVEAGISQDKAEELCLKARALLMSSGFLDREFIPATEVLERRKSMARV